MGCVSAVSQNLAEPGWAHACVHMPDSITISPLSTLVTSFSVFSILLSYKLDDRVRVKLTEV